MTLFPSLAALPLLFLSSHFTRLNRNDGDVKTDVTHKSGTQADGRYRRVQGTEVVAEGP
jgi:hypothetical protein